MPAGGLDWVDLHGVGGLAGIVRDQSNSIFFLGGKAGILPKVKK